MSVDKNVTEELMELLQDSSDGFSAAAEKLADSDRPELGTEFRKYAAQRSTFYNELEALAAAYGDDLEESGSFKAAAHRVWMGAKDAISGSDPDGVLDAAEQGEEHAVSTYADALEQEISADLVTTVRRQLDEIQAVHTRVKALKASAD